MFIDGTKITALMIHAAAMSVVNAPMASNSTHFIVKKCPPRILESPISIPPCYVEFLCFTDTPLQRMAIPDMPILLRRATLPHILHSHITFYHVTMVGPPSPKRKLERLVHFIVLLFLPIIVGVIKSFP